MLAATLAAASVAALSACGATPPGAAASPTPSPVAPLGAAALSPASLKADFADDLVVRGSGFDSTTTAIVEGGPLAGKLPWRELRVKTATTVVDDETLRVHFAAADAHALLGAGDYRLRVVRGDAPDAETTASLFFHVRPVLVATEHVRTLPKLFLRNGGFLNVYVIPTDSTARFVGPGTELGGAAGLGHANFQLTNVAVTPLAGGDAIHPDFTGVNDVLFDPVSKDRPLAVALAIDQSGSIATTQNGAPASDPDDQRITQSENFIAGLSPEDRVEVLAFNGNANNVPVIVPFTADAAALTTGLDTLRTGENGGTPLYDAMIKSVDEVAAVDGTVTRAAIVLTDGRDNGSNATAAQAIANAQAKGIPIFAIGLGNPADPNSLDRAVLQGIADQTGGRFFFAADPTALATVFDTISGLLKSTYELDCGVSFDPPVTTPGAYVLTGDVVTTVDGTTRTTPLPPLNLSLQ